jgi:hypothetical protein
VVEARQDAVVAQLVERLLAKEKVAGSNPVRRSNHIGGSSNGRTAAFEAVYHGSNPCPPAILR